MKYKSIFIAVLFALSLFTMDANAQKRELEHSIEVTTGYPSLIFNLEYPTLNAEMVHYRPYGKQVDKKFQPGLNIGYTLSWSDRWELNALVNVHLTPIDILQYPSLSGADTNTPNIDNYDWNADVVSKERVTDVSGSVCAAVRYKWMVREGFCCYSGLGLGVAYSSPIPLPYIAPVGIKFGKGLFYGLAEVNVSAANTFGMVGFGIRVK